MEVGTTLTQLLTDLRHKCRASDNSASNKSVRQRQIYCLNDAQRQIWEEHNWAHLHYETDITLSAGQRYYDVPSNMNA